MHFYTLKERQGRENDVWAVVKFSPIIIDTLHLRNLIMGVRCFLVVTKKSLFLAASMLKR